MATPRIDRLEENIFINGGMTVAQRSTGPLPVLPTYVAIDRWYVYESGTTSPLTRRTGPIGHASPFISQYTHGMNATINAATDTLGMGQRIEASRVRRIMAGENKISLSCNIAPSVPADVEVLVRYNNDGEDNFSGTKTIIHQQLYPVGNGEFTIKVEDLDLPDIALDNGIEVNFTITNWSATGAQFVDMSDAMLNPGSIVAEFNERPLDVELDLCRRYFESRTDFVSALVAIGQATATNSAYFLIHYYRKRTIPSVTMGPANTDFNMTQPGGGGLAINSIGASRQRLETVQISATTPSALFFAGQATSIVTTTANAFIHIDAEL